MHFACRSPSCVFVATIVSCAGVGQAVFLEASRAVAIEAHQGGNKTAAWIQSSSRRLRSDSLKLRGEPGKLTAIVTYAGQRKTEYIDAAVMLGQSLQRHASGYPMVALAIDGMSTEHQKLLTNAGWQLLFVENWEEEYCDQGCNQEFLHRWHDSFEKINIFRLEFDRVLFMDADTYVFSDRLQELLTATHLPEGHIAMSPDGCKGEYNSGVMLFRPNVDTFRSMLTLVSSRQREQLLDQNIINEVYAGRIVELEREFNCVDLSGKPPGAKEECSKKCSADVVVAHFTGHPKPTAAKRRLLELVRRPGSPTISCPGTNFGSCSKWSAYYCDIRATRKSLSKNLQGWLKKTGECCHTPFNPKHDQESCLECPNRMNVDGGERLSALGIRGSYMKSNIKPTKYNGGKPIYVKTNGPQIIYMYYVQKQVLWMIGNNYTNNSPFAYALLDAGCPRDVDKWHLVVDGQWAWYKNVTVTSDAFLTGTQPMQFDVQGRTWVVDDSETTADPEEWD